MITVDPKLTAHDEPLEKYPNYSKLDPQTVAAIQGMAQNLIKYANDRGYVLEIGLQSAYPPAMGDYRQTVGIRKVRAQSVPLAVAGLSNKPIPKD